jgi:hypothetical protein
MISIKYKPTIPLRYQPCIGPNNSFSRVQTFQAGTSCRCLAETQSCSEWEPLLHCSCPTLLQCHLQPTWTSIYWRKNVMLGCVARVPRNSARKYLFNSFNESELPKPRHSAMQMIMTSSKATKLSDSNLRASETVKESSVLRWSGVKR